MEDKIKPCPFCGSDDLVPSFHTDDDAMLVCVSCDACDVEGPTVRYVDRSDGAEALKRAHAAWNRRK